MNKINIERVENGYILESSESLKVKDQKWVFCSLKQLNSWMKIHFSLEEK